MDTENVKLHLKKKKKEQVRQPKYSNNTLQDTRWIFNFSEP